VLTAPPKWLWLALMSTFWWGLWAFLVKLASGHLDPFQLQALFVAGMLPLMLLVIARRGPTLKADRLGIVYGLLNGVLATLGMLAFYAAMERGRASIVGPVTALFPIVTVAGSTLFLRERLNAVQCVGICLALAALLLFA
jgi:transporter family protein